MAINIYTYVFVLLTTKQDGFEIFCRIRINLQDPDLRIILKALKNGLILDLYSLGSGQDPR